MSRNDNASDEIKPIQGRVGGGNILMENTTQATPRTKRFFIKCMAMMLVLLSAALLGAGTVAQAAEGEGEKFVVVLDAGHGGRDPGAIDPVDDYTEADIVQNMTERIGKYFAAHDEVEVVYTHAAGEFVPIGQRTALANSVGADLFVSMHLNAAENTDAQGFQIFPAPPGRANHATSLQLAEDILPHVREIGRPVRGGNGVFYAYYRNGEKDFYDATEYNQVNNRASFGVVDGVDCASVLVESWFITNRDDMEFFHNEQGMDLMSRQLYRGLCTNLGIDYKA